MSRKAIADAPIFFIGFPRSGTTVAFEAFCRHPSLGWPTNYSERLPAIPMVEGIRRLLDNSVIRLAGKKGQYGKTLIGNRFLPQPHEAYRFWDLHTNIDFSRTFLRDRVNNAETAEHVREAVRRVLYWQGRSRFAAKFTGPPRIRFLDSVFPNCRFVHVVRDGRAAVHSLLRVGFWREKGGLEEPFWKGGLSTAQLQKWRDDGEDSGALAALQWSAVLQAARDEASQIESRRYREVRYEDFVESSHEIISEINEFCGLEDLPAGHRYLDDNPMAVDMNQKYRQDFSADYIRMLTSLMQPLLSSLRYPG